jgi:uncharacterized pyridoxamine 5'-phosphate oxidase family protein
MQFIEERNEALNFLQDNPLGVLSTINGSHFPEMAPIYFFVESDFSCSFLTKTNTRKFRNLSENEKAALLTFSEETLTTVEVQGRLSTEHDPLRIAQILEAFAALALSRKGAYWVPPVSQIENGAFAVCTLKAEGVLYTSYATELADPGVPRQLSFRP